MIIHRFSVKHGVAVLTPEDVDDLWVLRRILSSGDVVTGEGSRIVRTATEFSRPDRGERVRVTVTIRIEKVRLDNELARLRVTGPILEVSDDEMPRGSFHSLLVSPGHRIGVRKERWDQTASKLIQSSQLEETRFYIVAVDRREAGIGKVTGTHLHMFPTVESDEVGKVYRVRPTRMDGFCRQIVETLQARFQKGDKVYIVGPGPMKYSLANYLKDRSPALAATTQVVEGGDVAGQDGVYVSLRSPQLRNYVRQSKIAMVSALLEEVVRRIAVSDDRVVMGLPETTEAARVGAVESLVVSDQVFTRGIEEGALVDLLNTVEARGGRAYLLDASTDLGVQASTLGGIVGLLRYAFASTRIR